ncbi:sure-like protein [Metschnikowia bicuspidata var. bicuspidata NRRL YB-4993]|uniref:Sure-like protein n=1 Tax=Metschnikowia bicuspidata var. bicuspidata NRRL YB-4993 TaxID=869754 RepID=A0A1A0HFK6_9ASCO|nr:sure-like protein [Metschnikowia bicuspidata var. bicuspidata NRRL YB-4993]OBA22934.1 sure-like protein [Metschnikowia bicuspidata var. bicuspidata NRRL YB-4993]
MHVLLTNDDGPLDDKSCPYMKYFVDEICRSTDWKVLIVVPDQQRSWIGKAHFAGKRLTTTYVYTRDSTSEPSTDINKYDGPFDTRQHELIRAGFQEWHLIDSTPAACADIGLHHLPEAGPVDLVISGPNFGKNSGDLYILASGTVGAAMEAATHGTKSIALLYEFRSLQHDFHTLKEASRISVRLVEHLYEEMQARSQIDLFSVNVPLVPSLELGKSKIKYAPILSNKWASIYEHQGDGKYAWAPKFQQVWDESLDDLTHSDSRVLHDDGISVTPLQATFKAVQPLEGEIVLAPSHRAKPVSGAANGATTSFVLITAGEDAYIFQPLSEAYKKLDVQVTTDVLVLKQIPQNARVKVFHYGEYEDLDLDLIQTHPSQYFTPSYIYRKALIRKHYLANTIHHFVVKNPQSILVDAVPPTYQLEVDYAEFLDDSLDDAYELREEVEQGDKTWILKPSMSDKGQGIRVFRTLEQLQAIFDSFEEGRDSDDEEDELHDEQNNGVIISQLRHFIVQEYQDKPLLLQEYGSKKFHLRTYVVGAGDLKVFVYEQILALFADAAYENPGEKSDDPMIDLAGHLTNTCLQEGKDPLVVSFWDLMGLDVSQKTGVFEQVKEITGQLFAAASSVDKINFQPMANAVEIFGVDFLVNEDLSVKLLEVNSYPDFKQTGDGLKTIIDDLFDSVARLIVGPDFFQSAPVGGSTALLHRVL